MDNEGLKKVLQKKYIIIVLLGMLGYTLIAIVGNVLQYQRYQKELSKHNETIDQLSQDNLQLSELLSFLNSDEAVDAYARTRLGYKKEGERAFIITEDSVESTTRVDDIPVETESTPTKWFRYYFK